MHDLYELYKYNYKFNDFILEVKSALGWYFYHESFEKHWELAIIQLFIDDHY